MKNSKLHSLDKKRFKLVCIKIIESNEIKRINWLDANELVKNNSAIFINK